jgi:hypothetical protein
VPEGFWPIRKIIAGLLALILLALPGGPLPHPAMAMHAHQATATHLSAGQDEVAPARAGGVAHGEQDDHPPCDHEDRNPGPGCCPVAHCPPCTGAPPPAMAEPVPMAGPIVLLAVLARDGGGIDIAPTTPPPRDG